MKCEASNSGRCEERMITGIVFYVLLQGSPLEGALKLVIPLRGEKLCTWQSTSRSAGLNCWKVRVPRVVRLPGFSSMVLFSTDSKRPTKAASEICSAHESHKNIFRFKTTLVVSKSIADLSGSQVWHAIIATVWWLLYLLYYSGYILLCIGAWVEFKGGFTFGGYSATASSIFWRICLHSSVACMSPALAAATSCRFRSPSGVLAVAWQGTPCIW